MFGKNYDKEIRELQEHIKVIQESLISTQKSVNMLMDESNRNLANMISIAKNGAIHKEAISFLLNNCSFDKDAQKDFILLLKKISEHEKLAKKGVSP